MTDKGRVRVRVSGYLLREVLHLPDGVWIEDAAMPYDQGRDIIELVLSGPDFPVVPEGEEPPLAEASVKHTPEQYEWHWDRPRG